MMRDRAIDSLIHSVYRPHTSIWFSVLVERREEGGGKGGGIHYSLISVIYLLRRSYIQLPVFSCDQGSDQFAVD